MPGSRITILAMFVALLATAPPASAQDDPAPDIYPLTFPVVGENTYTDTFGAPRSGGRTHEGTDILADKMVPVVAAASGTVGWIDKEQGGDCCHLAVNHDDGWSTWYIHLNNDTPGTDDGLGMGIADGIDSGVRVEAGQLIGWVGDSGNAEESVSHLHFELRGPEGVAINSYEHLLAATVIGEAGDAPPPAEASVTFSDIASSVHAENILQLAELGITGGCEPGMYCPDDPVTRAQMATFLVRALELPETLADSFDDDNGSVHEPNIEALATAEITLGCGERAYCPHDAVTRAQMATFLVRALDLSETLADSFDDDNGTVHEPNIEALAAAQVTLGCGDRAYCPEAAVTRAQMATFLIRALDADLVSRPDGPLVPSEGVLVGAAVDGDISDYEAAIGRTMDVAHVSFEGVIDFEAVQTHLDAGRIPLVSWTPGTVDDAVIGNLDAYVATAAESMAAASSPIFLRYWPDLDAAVESSDQLVDVWSRAREAFDAAGADNVVWVWSPAALSPDNVPGAFDWLASTIYGNACAGGDVTSFADPAEGLVTAAAEIGAYPLMVAAWGVGPVDGQPDAQSVFVDSISESLESHPEIAAIVAVEGETDCDWRLAGTDAGAHLATVVAEVAVDLSTLLG